MTEKPASSWERFSLDSSRPAIAAARKHINDTRMLKKQLMEELSGWIAEHGLRQADAAEILMVSRPRVSDVVNKKTASFTIDCLVEMLGRIGKPVRLARLRDNQPIERISRLLLGVRSFNHFIKSTTGEIRSSADSTSLRAGRESGTSQVQSQSAACVSRQVRDCLPDSSARTNRSQPDLRDCH